MDFTRKRPKNSGLELTPLIDVVFLLLVFLILTANFQLPSLSLQLPGGASEDDASEHVVLVELQENGELAVDGESVERELLTDRLRDALEPLELRAVRLRADERVPYGQLLPVIDAARAAGALAVDLVHEGGGG